MTHKRKWKQKHQSHDGGNNAGSKGDDRMKNKTKNREKKFPYIHRPALLYLDMSPSSTVMVSFTRDCFGMRANQ